MKPTSLRKEVEQLSDSPHLETNDESDTMDDISNLEIKCISESSEGLEELLSEVDEALAKLRIRNTRRNAALDFAELNERSRGTTPERPETEVEDCMDEERVHVYQDHRDSVLKSSIQALIACSAADDGADLIDRIKESDAKIMSVKPTEFSVASEEMRQRQFQIMQEALLLELSMDSLASSLRNYSDDLGRILDSSMDGRSEEEQNTEVQSM